ncbi:SEC-C metal-binding domain-containing protein [Methylogaea oryzae]|uniref:SEC-C metal-binding domain-containing protein n=1 Tax=Methylogaea oryzae TaxID=1295382 RepID=UPI00357118D4
MPTRPRHNGRPTRYGGSCCASTASSPTTSRRNGKRPTSSSVPSPTRNTSRSRQTPLYPENAMIQTCPCGSGAVYAACCSPYHQAKSHPPPKR